MVEKRDYREEEKVIIEVHLVEETLLLIGK